MPNCFGVEDLIHAAHPSEEGWAKTLIDGARGFAATDDDIRSSVRDFLADLFAPAFPETQLFEDWLGGCRDCGVILGFALRGR